MLFGENYEYIGMAVEYIVIANVPLLVALSLYKKWEDIGLLFETASGALSLQPFFTCKVALM